jgi:tetratricopeptide (TPR) repeat protein
LILGVLSLPKALDIMRGFLVLSESEERALEELCDELRQLTFAIRISASILERGVLPLELLMRLRCKGARVYDNLAKREDSFGRNPSLASLFDESFEALKRDTRPASSLALNLAAVGAWFAPVSVPGPLLVAAAAAISTDLDSSQEELFLEAVSMLVEYSLASRSVTNGQISFHRLLQLYGRERFGAPACKAMVFAVQEVGSVEDHKEHFRQACLWAFHEPKPLVDFEGEGLNQFIDKVCLELALQHVNDVGNLVEARSLLVHASKRLSKGTPLWWRAVCIEGLILGEEGRYDEAERLQRQALEGRESTLGSMHPETLRSLNNLASVLASQHRFNEAEVLLRRTIEGRKIVLGSTHPHTLDSMLLLATTLYQKGQHAEAEALERHVMEICKAELGADNRSTLVAMQHLAYFLTRRGCAAEAEELLQHVLRCKEARVGPMHPFTLDVVDDLAYAVRQQGRNHEAEVLNRRALLGREVSLGPTHQETLQSLTNLGVSILNLGRHAEAEQLFRRAFKIKSDTLGVNHVSTLLSANNLAIAIEAQGRLLEAEEIHRDVLVEQESTLGLVHPDTLRTVEYLGCTLTGLRKYGEAVRLLRRALEGRMTILGPMHPETMSSKRNLAITIQKARRRSSSILSFVMTCLVLLLAYHYRKD